MGQDRAAAVLSTPEGAAVGWYKQVHHDLSAYSAFLAAFDPKGVCRNDFKPACERAGLVFHELRHIFTTLSLESRALAMYELSVAMGHESEAITNKAYAHLRKKDYSGHRAAFSAHVVAASVTPMPIRAIGS